MERHTPFDHPVDTLRSRLRRPVRAAHFALDNALGRRLVTYMVLWSLGLALISTATQLWVNYRRDLAEIEHRMVEIGRSSMAGVAFAARKAGKDQLAVELSALLGVSDLAYVALSDPQGHLIADAGAAIPDAVIYVVPVIDLEPASPSDIVLGRLSLQASKARIYADIRADAIVTLASQLCEILLVSGMMLLIFGKVVSKPLSALARAAAATDVTQLGDPIALRRPPHESDDLDTLVNSLNLMRTKLKADIDAQASYRDELELRVVQRTADLDAKLAELQAQREEQRVLFDKLELARQHAMHSEKMASIGQLAAGVAHEINNPVGFVLSNFNSLDRYMKDVFATLAAYEAVEPLLPASHAGVAALREGKESADLEFIKSDIQQLLSESCDGLDRVKRIVRDLKDFSHSGATGWERSDLVRGLESTLNVVRNEIKYKAEVIKRYGGMPEIDCQPSQINQVFMNLLVNAAHAIAHRGTITLSTGVAGEEVWVEVADTGSGMAPEVMERIFDPFFTTKPVGQGTGLGLSLSYSIVRGHGGRIEVDSVVGAGTSFKVWLPIRQACESAQAEVV